MIPDLLARLSSAAPAEKESVLVEFLMSEYPKSLQEAVWAVAPLHWFDPSLLEAVLTVGNAAARRSYAALRALPFVEEFPGRGHTLRESTRIVLLTRLKNSRPRLALYCSRAMKYFSGRSDPDAQIEYLYHSFAAGSENAESEFARITTEWATTGHRLPDPLSARVIAAGLGGSRNIREVLQRARCGAAARQAMERCDRRL
jgi:hypothetical protein